eukprot:scaffold210619_cov28-Tisochrysis_lutea.AAC.3
MVRFDPRGKARGASLMSHGKQRCRCPVYIRKRSEQCQSQSTFDLRQEAGTHHRRGFGRRRTRACLCFRCGIGLRTLRQQSHIDARASDE